MKDLTVAICTYKRHDLLRTTLDSLAACEPIDAACELLVIDNECHEEVREIVEAFAARHPIPDTRYPTVRYIAEPQTGTSHARNRAVTEATAPVILFTDDDVTFDARWLARMWSHIQAQPTCAFWGGKVEPVWTMPKPHWFDPGRCAMLGDTIVQYDRGSASRPWDAASDPPFYTANLAFRVNVIRAAGGFDTSVGHRGNIRMGMEDSLMVKAVAKAGGGWYAADAIVHHPVPAERMKKKYAREFAWRQGWLSAEMTRRGGDLSGGKGRMPRWFYRVALTQLMRGVGQMAAGLCTFDAAKRFGGRVSATFNLSKLWHAVKG